MEMYPTFPTQRVISKYSKCIYKNYVDLGSRRRVQKIFLGPQNPGGPPPYQLFLRESPPLEQHPWLPHVYLKIKGKSFSKRRVISLQILSMSKSISSCHVGVCYLFSSLYLRDKLIFRKIKK